MPIEVRIWPTARLRNMQLILREHPQCAMTGLIVAGADRPQAVRPQVVVFMLLAAVSLSATLDSWPPPGTRSRRRCSCGGRGADYLGPRRQLLDVRNPSRCVPNPYDRNSTSFLVDSVDDPAWLAANPLSSSRTCSCERPWPSSSSRRPLRTPATKLMRSWISSQVASSGSC